MELLLLALAIMAVRSEKSDRARKDLLPLLDLLESGDLARFAQSDFFKNLQIGGISGKQLADALRTLQKLSESKGENALLELLSSVAGTNFGGVSALSQMLFSQKNTSAGGGAHEERSASENPLAPVAKIADPEIVYRLNQYFSEAV